MLFHKHIWKIEKEYYDPSIFEKMTKENLYSQEGFLISSIINDLVHGDFISLTTIIFHCEKCGKIKIVKVRGMAKGIE